MTAHCGPRREGLRFTLTLGILAGDLIQKCRRYEDARHAASAMVGMRESYRFLQLPFAEPPPHRRKGDPTLVTPAHAAEPQASDVWIGMSGICYESSSLTSDMVVEFHY